MSILWVFLELLYFSLGPGPLRDAGCYSLIIIVSATILLRSRYWMIALTSRNYYDKS